MPHAQETRRRFLLADFARDERAVASIEYALLAATMGTAVLVGAQEFGRNLQEIFGSVAGIVRSASR